MSWFVIRGWAIGGAAAGAVVAVFTRPPYPLVGQGWFASVVFAVAAVLMFALSLRPWSRRLRGIAVAAMVLAAGSRVWGLLLLGHGNRDNRVISAASWALVGLFTWLLGALTYRAGRDARDPR